MDDKNKSMKKILIVEDELLLALLNRKIVESAGYTVAKSLTKGEDAIAYVKDNEIDLILMDIFLAGETDGVTAVEEIRKFSQTPVIFVSGNSDKSTRNRAESIIGASFMVKPVLPAALKNAVKEKIG